MVIISLLAVMWVSAKQGYKQINGDFFQRNFLIQHFNQLRLTIGDKVFAPNVLVGVNGWLEYTGVENIDGYQKVVAFPENKLTTINRYLQRASSIGQKNNIEFLIVVAPDKPTIYPDQVPGQIVPIGQKSKLDQMIEDIPKYPNVQILDLRPALRSARQEQDVYFKTDTHWNHFGAYIAYKEIIGTLSEKYPELQPYPHDTIQFTESYIVRDLAKIILDRDTKELSLRAITPDFVRSIEMQDHLGYHETTWIPNSSAPVALVYHDSFGILNLNNYLMLNFSKTHFVHIDGFKYRGSKAIEFFQPDIIIIEIVERNLVELPNILSGITSE